MGRDLTTEAPRHREEGENRRGALREDHDALTDQVIGLAIEVHRHLGPGLLESAYEECLCYELRKAQLEFTRQHHLPIVYKEIRLDAAYRIDLIVEQRLVIEIKTVERLLPIHEAQLITYLRLSGLRVGLLMNFNTAILKEGLRRISL